MARRKCADVNWEKPPPQIGGVLLKPQLPKIPEGYRWRRYTIHEEWGREDWWHLEGPNGEDIHWLTGPKKRGDPKVRAGWYDTPGWWYDSPEEAVTELLTLWRLGVPE